MGCNHMICYNCNTHFCYLCGFWIPADNPYKHFNVQGGTCFQRLWELEEGDEGQGPEDGREFGGARAAEEAAAEFAREADAAEAARLQAEEDAMALPAAPDPPARGVPLADVLARMNLLGEVDVHGLDVEAPQPRVVEPPQQQPRGGRRQRNPFPGARPPGQRAAQAVRNHERGGRGGQGRGGRRLPAARAGDDHGDVDDRQQIHLARFLEAAGRDREEEWDSDEMGDDEDFHIPLR
jgi:E3 ubiquitin-protein ligase RNF14